MAQVTLDPSANGHYTAWTGDYTAVDDGATPDEASTVITSSTNGQQETFFVPNVGSGSIPDGAVINYVEMSTRALRGAGGAAFYNLVSTSGPTPYTSPSFYSPTASWAEYTWQMTQDPSTSSAWAIATIRAWYSGGANERAFGVQNNAAKACDVTRIRVVIDYTVAATYEETGAALSVLYAAGASSKVGMLPDVMMAPPVPQGQRNRRW